MKLEKRAATRLQHELDEDTRNEAAISIQATWRGHATRKMLGKNEHKIHDVNKKSYKYIDPNEAAVMVTKI